MCSHVNFAKFLKTSFLKNIWDRLLLNYFGNSYPLISTRTSTYQGISKCSFFGKFDVFCLLETSVLRFAFLPYYRQLPVGKSVNTSELTPACTKKTVNLFKLNPFNINIRFLCPLKKSKPSSFLRFSGREGNISSKSWLTTKTQGIIHLVSTQKFPKN